MCWGEAVLLRHCRGTPSGGTCWDTVPGGSCRPCCAGGPVGPYGTLSPSDSDPADFAGGPVGLCGMLSPFKYDPAGPDGLYVSDGPLSPSNPGGVFPLSDPTPGGTLPPGVERLPSCKDGVGTPAGGGGGGL